MGSARPKSQGLVTSEAIMKELKEENAKFEKILLERYPQDDQKVSAEATETHKTGLNAVKEVCERLEKECEGLPVKGETDLEQKESIIKKIGILKGFVEKEIKKIDPNLRNDVEKKEVASPPKGIATPKKDAVPKKDPDISKVKATQDILKARAILERAQKLYDKATERKEEDFPIQTYNKLQDESYLAIMEACEKIANNKNVPSELKEKAKDLYAKTKMNSESYLLHGRNYTNTQKFIHFLVTYKVNLSLGIFGTLLAAAKNLFSSTNSQTNKAPNKKEQEPPRNTKGP